ncbi:hypothetical protein BDV93DRAFT_565655 [Ceratobasidium sp. AG-I]|nr:hypothetical protein BDV93DRAFT_565655 [Ceratobasidium sp. AG-I]
MSLLAVQVYLVQPCYLPSTFPLKEVGHPFRFWRIEFADCGALTESDSPRTKQPFYACLRHPTYLLAQWSELFLDRYSSSNTGVFADTTWTTCPDFEATPASTRVEGCGSGSERGGQAWPVNRMECRALVTGRTMGAKRKQSDEKRSCEDSYGGGSTTVIPFVA